MKTKLTGVRDLEPSIPWNRSDRQSLSNTGDRAARAADLLHGKNTISGSSPAEDVLAVLQGHGRFSNASRSNRLSRRRRR